MNESATIFDHDTYTDVSSPTNKRVLCDRHVGWCEKCLNHANNPTDQKEVLQSWWNVALHGSMHAQCFPPIIKHGSEQFPVDSKFAQL